MATGDTVWGIDVGQCALKALKLRNVDGTLQVEAFDIIEHPRMLSQPEVNRDQLIANALEQFLARNNLAGAKVVIAAPGQSGFTRFVKLPPVEMKQVPEIVRFEAEQQIPFNIHEVIWRWQDFKDPDSPDIEVGIFAMKRADVAEALDRFTEAGIAVDIVQMAPLALYNFMTFDGQTAADGATLLVDVGADKTELVVADGPRVWTRTIQLGGNNFTAALVKAFKLSFSKAEKFKRQAATSKYAPQIFKAMQPVFAELVQEISRSIGYYTSLHRDSRFKRVIGLGNGFRLPGLQTFLERNLNIPVIRLDGYNELPPSAVVNAPAFTENVLSFAAAYGLALQGLGLTKVRTSLLPSEIARQRLWKRKNAWFAAVAATFLVCLGVGVWVARGDNAILQPGDSLARAEAVVDRLDGYREKYRRTIEGDISSVVQEIRKYDEMLYYRGVWPEIHGIISDAVVTQADHNQGRMNAESLPELLKVPRDQRHVVQIDSLTPEYRDNVAGVTAEQLRGQGPAGGAYRDPGPYRPGGGYPGPGGMEDYGPNSPLPPGARRGGASPMSPTSPEAAPVTPADATGPARPGYVITLEGSTPLREPVPFITGLKIEVMERAKTYREVEAIAGEIVMFKRGGQAAAAGSGSGGQAGLGPVGPSGTGEGEVRNPANTDPLTGEDTSMDTYFTIKWVFAIKAPQAGNPGPANDAGGER